MEFKNSSNATTLELSEESLSARRALDGAYVMLRLEGRPIHWGFNAQILSGRLQLGSNTNPPMLWPVFELTNANSQGILQADNRVYLNFEGYLTYAQLEAFESTRGGRPFRLSCPTATLQVVVPNKGLAHWTNGGQAPQLSDTEWLSTLDQAGFKRHIVQVMAFPPDHARSNEPSVYQYLHTARDYFDKDLYEPCVLELRKALELLFKQRNDRKLVDDTVNTFSNKGARTSMLVEDRIATIRFAIYHATHNAAHVNNDPSYFRREAKALMACVGAMIELFPEPDLPVTP